MQRWGNAWLEVAWVLGVTGFQVLRRHDASDSGSASPSTFEVRGSGLEVSVRFEARGPAFQAARSAWPRACRASAPATSASACRRRPGRASACAFESTSGGARRIAFLPAPRIRTPRRNIAWTTRVALLDGALLRLAIAHQLDADHQALAAHVADQRVLRPAARAARRSGARRPSPRSPTSAALSSLIVAIAAAHDDGIAAERAGVRAGRPRHDVGARAGDAERQARRDALGDVHDVGLHAEVLATRTSSPCAPCPTALRRRRAGCRAASSARAAPAGTLVGGTM